MGTVFEYNVEESGITETIAAVYQSQEARLGRFLEKTTKLSRVCTVGLHLRRHGFVLGFPIRIRLLLVLLSLLLVRSAP